MVSGIYEAVAGGLFAEKHMEMITNNLANINTAGFKKDVLTFDEVLQEKQSTDLSQGSLNYTGNQLDIALGEKGFFKIQTDHGIRYTRNGSFLLNAENMLVTQNGDKVLGENGPIHIKGAEIAISTSGNVSVDGVRVATLSAVDFTHRNFLTKEGNSLYVYDDPNGEGSIIDPDAISVKQGYLEASNVNPLEEMTKMIMTQRAYESCAKVIQTFDEADSKAINEVGRL